MTTPVIIDGRTLNVPDDIAQAIGDGLTNQKQVHEPHANTFDDLIPVISGLTRLIRHLDIARETAMAKADATSPYANRRAIGMAAAMGPTQVGRVMERNGRPRNRRTAEQS